MSDEYIKISDPTAHWNVAGTKILKYSLEMSHSGLNEHKLISAPETGILVNKAEMQGRKWMEKWNKLQDKKAKEREKNANLGEAERRTIEAEEALKQIDNLLLHTLSIDDTVDWESIKNKDGFSVPEPPKPEKDKYKKLASKPNKSSPAFTPHFNLLELIFKPLRKRKIDQTETDYNNAVRNWEKQKDKIELYNKEIDGEYIALLDDWNQAVQKWEMEKEKYHEKQKEYNDKIDTLKEMYLKEDSIAVTEYCEMVLNNSEYPDSFPKDFEIEYNPENQILIVEYQLPSKECFQRIKEVKYIASRKELKESYISESAFNKMYDSAIYQIALRTIHELFEADAADALSAVSFNGWDNSINKATGKEENKCILSIQANKSEFMAIELANVDPKQCFKNLKGVASSKLSTLTAVQPILQISKTDKRFVDSYDVADTLDEATNVAAMDWEDFEHLIREIFEKEFSQNGGEVKVTQASRDGGVDAIAFDPDPIRGGKIVIQAKRYTNTVGVSAVRDLYGTVVNEGATKGLLVTTADYGPDAYEFAKGKPLTLLSGSNLLHLLEKHGHHAKIDLKEAKKVLAENKE